MSKAVKSDGKVNALVYEMAIDMINDRLLVDEVKIDMVLKEENLTQCKHETLCLVFAAYYHALKKKNWVIHKHIDIKARQSEEWRRFKNDPRAETMPSTATGEKISPLDQLLARAGK